MCTRVADNLQCTIISIAHPTLNSNLHTLLLQHKVTNQFRMKAYIHIGVIKNLSLTTSTNTSCNELQQKLHTCVKKKHCDLLPHLACNQSIRRNHTSHGQICGVL